jgi:tripartite-type tricarboxylate transporter receptor subunit TctC
MKLPRRQFLQLAAGAAALPVTSRIARAQSYPARPITLIVPWTAGGTTDVALRALANETQKHLGQTILIDNRPGAAGTLGPQQMAAAAKPDGYTVSQIFTSVFRAPFLRKTPYDPSKDFSYIIGVSGYTQGLVVRADAPWKTLQDFLADARANPGKINYGAQANGNALLTMKLIAKHLNIDLVAVPYKGGPEGVNALLGGHINAHADSSVWAPQVNAGQFRLLATFGAARTTNWPSVPTLKESGLTVDVNNSYGIAGPKGMDPKLVKFLHDAFKKGMEDPSFTAVLAQLGQELIYLNSADYHAFAIKQIEEEKRLVEELGLKEE